MTQPLALVFYEKLMPGSQLVNRLQDLNYLVRVVSDLASFQESARAEGPLLRLWIWRAATPFAAPSPR